MRKIIDTQNGNFNWQDEEVIQSLLNVSRLPRFIIIETIEEE